MRKIFIILLIIVSVTAVAISIYFVWPRENEVVVDSLYDAIPVDAGIIVDISNYGVFCQMTRDNPLLQQLAGVPSIGHFLDQTLRLDSLSRQLHLSTQLQHIIFSLHSDGKDAMRGIGYVKIENDKEGKTLYEQLKRVFATASLNNRQYDHTTVTDVVFGDRTNNNFSFAYRQGIFIFSQSSILLENALRQISDNHKITNQKALTGLMRTAGKNSPANIYINYNHLPRTALTLFHSKHKTLLGAAANYASWTELDLTFKPDILVLNGFTEVDPAEEHRLAMFRTQPALPITLVNAMPSTTYSYLWFGIRNLNQYLTDFSRYLEHHKITGYKKELSRIQTAYHIDLHKDFAELFEDEAALVYANVGQTESKEAPFVVFRVKSTSGAIAAIAKWQEACNNKKTASLQFDHQLTFTSYQFPFDIPRSIFGDLFAGQNSWCVAADNYIVFGSSPENLKKYLHYTALHACLQTDVTYGKLVNHFATRSNISFYCNPSLGSSLLENVLKYEFAKELENAKEVTSRLQAVVFQLNTSGNMLYNNIFIRSSMEESAVVGSQTSWESLLDTAIAFKPQLVQNHSTGETDVFVQDMANNIYLLNNVGRILWKMPVQGPILGQAYQIDYYKNGKLQLLFNTREYLYIIDRLGNPVEKYPIKLPSPAVGGTALFDYDNNRDYRIMVPCEDRKVYAYDKTGKAVEGWGFRQSEYPVQTDIYHYRTGNKDFIVFADKYTTYILDRKGNTRVSPAYKFPVGQYTDIALDNARSPNQASLVLTDTMGTIHRISLTNGNITKTEIKKFPNKHYFVFQDATGDRQDDYIYAYDNKVEVFHQNGKPAFNIETEEPMSLRPYVYEFSSSDIRIGIVQPTNNKIYLYSNNGKVQSGFPLKGSTLFSIGRLDKNSTRFNLFVGSQNNFLYNYSVK